jgi:hypothetical protein
MVLVGAFLMQECEKKNFWRNLDLIKDHLLFDEDQFAIYLGVSSSYLRKKKMSNSLLDLICVVELTEKINVHLEDLFKSDFKLNSSFVNNIYKMNLDARYNIATHSKTRSIANILSYLEKNVGLRAKFNVLRKFQITEDFINNDSSNVNVMLITDIINYLKYSYEMDDGHFYAMGQMTSKVSQNKFIKDQLIGLRSVTETFDFFVEMFAAKFDTNNTYRLLKNNSNSIVLEARPNKGVIEELGVTPETFGNESVCASKMGVLSTITDYKFGVCLPVKKLSSIYRGDRSDIFEFNPALIKQLTSFQSRIQNRPIIYQ